jgi:hypothetical protein
MGTQDEPPYPSTPAEDRADLQETRGQIQKMRHDVEELDARVSIAERQLAARGWRGHVH